jgi:hypothetical protein
VGLTFRPKERRLQHAYKGRVYDYTQVCPGYTYKVLKQGIGCPQDAKNFECHYINLYAQEGWTMLNVSAGGSLGTLRVEKWTHEAVLAEARKYMTRQEWIDKSQTSYRIAKRAGWFEEASAHMPKRVLGIGLGLRRSEDTCQKLSEAAQRRTSDPKWKAEHGARLKGRKLTDEHRQAISRALRTEPVNPAPATVAPEQAESSGPELTSDRV